MSVPELARDVIALRSYAGPSEEGWRTLHTVTDSLRRVKASVDTAIDKLEQEIRGADEFTINASYVRELFGRHGPRAPFFLIAVIDRQPLMPPVRNLELLCSALREQGEVICTHLLQRVRGPQWLFIHRALESLAETGSPHLVKALEAELFGAREVDQYAVLSVLGRLGVRAAPLVVRAIREERIDSDYIDEFYRLFRDGLRGAGSIDLTEAEEIEPIMLKNEVDPLAYRERRLVKFVEWLAYQDTSVHGAECQVIAARAALKHIRALPSRQPVRSTARY